MLCKNTFCGAKVRPFYEVTKDFNEKLQQRITEKLCKTLFTHIKNRNLHDLHLYILYIRCNLNKT